MNEIMSIDSLELWLLILGISELIKVEENEVDRERLRILVAKLERARKEIEDEHIEVSISIKQNL